MRFVDIPEFADLAGWPRFRVFVDTLLQKHGVKHWCGTLDTNAAGSCHLHLVLQFYKHKEQVSQDFAFEGCAPTLAQMTCLEEVLSQMGLAIGLRAFRS